ncbi:MAG: hypothetical protein H7222_09915 [Methylotenera sp.]|nr:hypothetical protein [Oligoflexia bacterium]
MSQSLSQGWSTWNWVIVVGLFLMISGQSGLATANNLGYAHWSLDQAQALPEANPEVPLTTRATVSGKVTFERRWTIVPMIMCQPQSLPCVKSHPYWVLTVTQDGVKYQLDTVYALGNENAPEAMNVNGALIRQGSQVSLEGRIQLISQGFAVISDLNRVDITMD